MEGFHFGTPLFLMGHINAHCSECIWYESINYQMYCKYLKKRITARKTPKYCRGYKNMGDYERTGKGGDSIKE